MAPTKLLLVGYGQAGKDSAGEWLQENFNCKFGGSTSFYLARHVARITGQPEQQCYEARRQNRDLWWRIGRELRDNDPGCLIREALANGNVIAGVRDKCEVVAAREQGLVDVIAWIENPNVPVDPTMEFTMADCDLVIPNMSDLQAFYSRLRVFAKLCGF